MLKCKGVVRQDVYIFAGTVKGGIAYGKPNATDKEIREAAINANIHEFIMTLAECIFLLLCHRHAALGTVKRYIRT